MADILIIDDDEDLAAILAAIVAQHGHAARTARNGREGLDRIREQRPDLLMLDLEMPRLAGPEMLRRLGPSERPIPFVLLSGAPGLSTVAQALGTPHYLAKPFSFEALVRTMERALA
jgi:DNA-binding NtrC family response regulator